MFEVYMLRHPDVLKKVLTSVHFFGSYGRVINVWNTLPADRVYFSSFAAFKRTVQEIDLSMIYYVIRLYFMFISRLLSVLLVAS